MIFANNSRCKQNKKNPGHTFLDIVKPEMCAKFHIEFYGSWSSYIFQTFKQKPGFSKTIDLRLNFCNKFCITLLVLSNHNKISP